MDLDVQLTVLVSNLLVGAANVDMGTKTASEIQLCLLLIHNLRLSCKALKTIVEYNALCLAHYVYAMCTNEVKMVYLSCEHNVIKQFQLNLMWFSRSRHVRSTISRWILMSD